MMQTLRLSTKDNGSIEKAARIIRSGGMVAFPTETVYGLGGNALDGAAVERIFMAKGRLAWDPMIVHVSSLAMLGSVTTELHAQFDNLFAAFIPGPLTLVLPKNAMVPNVVTGGRETVAVRFSAHHVAQRLIAASESPIAAPSANRFGHVSPTTAEHVLADLDGRIDAVLDGGPCEIGVESPVLDLTAEPPRILRQGGLPREQLQLILADALVAGANPVSRQQEALPSQGMSLSHYAPSTKLALTAVREEALADAVQERSEQKVDALVPSQWKIPAAANFNSSRWGDWATLASRLSMLDCVGWMGKSSTSSSRRYRPRKVWVVRLGKGC